MNKPAPFLLFALLALLVSGCIDLKPQPDPTRYYVIGSAATAQPTRETEGLRLGVRDVAVPKYLDSSRIALRKGAHEIVYLQYERWGEEMSTSVARTVAMTLQDKPGVAYVATFPWPSLQRHDYVVHLDFSQFEGTTDGHVYVSGRWSIVNPADDTVASADNFSLTGSWSPGDYSSLASALDKAVVTVGDQVAAAVQKLPPPARQ